VFGFLPNGVVVCQSRGIGANGSPSGVGAATDFSWVHTENIKFKRCNKERKAVECTRDKSLHLVASSHNGLFYPVSLWELVSERKRYQALLEKKQL
jgi:hypothetical protein